MSDDEREYTELELNFKRAMEEHSPKIQSVLDKIDDYYGWQTSYC